MDARKLLEEAVSAVSGVDELAARVDSTLLSPVASLEEYLALVREAGTLGFRAVVVPSVVVGAVSGEAEKLGVAVAAVIGFPLGAVPLRSKLAEIEEVAEAGASEVDMVPWLSQGEEGLKAEIESIVSAAKARGLKVKVIVEAPLLTDEKLAVVVKAAAAAGAEFVKTSTGVYSKGGDPVTVSRLAREAKPLGLNVKAAGGIRTAVDALLAIAAGADVIGTSSAKRILDTYSSIIG